MTITGRRGLTDEDRDFIFRYMSNYRIGRVSRYARMFAALSNPNRTAIFLRLASCCGAQTSCSRDDMRACVGDLGKHLGIAASTVSHHIKELRDAGLIKLERNGRSVLCQVDPRAVRQLKEFFSGALDTKTNTGRSIRRCGTLRES